MLNSLVNTYSQIGASPSKWFWRLWEFHTISWILFHSNMHSPKPLSLLRPKKTAQPVQMALAWVETSGLDQHNWKCLEAGLVDWSLHESTATCWSARRLEACQQHPVRIQPDRSYNTYATAYVYRGRLLQFTQEVHDFNWCSLVLRTLTTVTCAHWFARGLWK